MTNSKWTARDIPDLSGMTFVVTGGNSGLGFETATELARKGAQVVLACRSPERGDSAVREIEKLIPTSTVTAMELDLASLDSIKSFSQAFKSTHTELHGLCNNAGVMALPERRTADGYEMQFGTNHLGHFALTAQLFDLIASTPGSRIVTVSSAMHLPGSMRWDDLQYDRGYQAWPAYCQSKLANLLFAFELGRRIGSCGSSTQSIACHPGYANTNLQIAGPKMAGSGFREQAMAVANTVFAQSAAMGALPTLYAATSRDAMNGDYIGPNVFGVWGYPRKDNASRRARSSEDSERLWQLSEDLTGTSFPVSD